MKENLTFLHSGACGDLIASLATVKEICERDGFPGVLLLDPTGGMSCNSDELNKIIRADTGGRGFAFSNAEIEFLRPLLESQPYISRVDVWDGGSPPEVDYNLNEMRKAVRNGNVSKRTNQNLELLYKAAFGLKETHSERWLQVDSCVGFGRNVLVARSTRYQSAHLWFAKMERALVSDAAFLGTKFEHDVFENAFRFGLPFADCHGSALDAARMIFASKAFVSNGTLFYWIAVGMGHPCIINELGVGIPTTYYRDAANIRYIQGGEIFK